MKLDSNREKLWEQVVGNPRGIDPQWIHDETGGSRRPTKVMILAKKAVGQPRTLISPAMGAQLLRWIMGNLLSSNWRRF